MVCPNGTVLKRPSDAEAGVCLGITPELDPREGLRRRGGRRGTGRARDRGLWRLRGTVGAGARPARVRRPGGRIGADRELSRLPDRHLRPGAGRPRLQPGAEVRRRARHPARGRAARLRRAASAVPAIRCGWSSPTAARCARAPWWSPRARATAGRISPTSRASRGRASPTGRRRSRRSCARARRWRWSAAAIRPARPWCSSRPRSGACTWWCAGRARGDHVALPDRPHRGTAQCRAARGHRGGGARGRPQRGPHRRDLPRSRDRRARTAARCAICSCSSAPIPTPPGCSAASPWTARASSSPAATAPTAEACGRPALPLETSLPGVFAIGDVRAGSTKRVAAAVGEGAAVVAQIHSVLALQAEEGVRGSRETFPR